MPHEWLRDGGNGRRRGSRPLPSCSVNSRLKGTPIYDIPADDIYIVYTSPPNFVDTILKISNK